MKAIATLCLLMALISAITGCGGGAEPQATGPASEPPTSVIPTVGATAGTTTAPGSALDLSYVFDANAKPVDVGVVLEKDSLVEALIPATGGSISATGADGTIYTLDVPADSLLNETTIGLTPVASISGLPFGGEQTHAVQLTPDGLFLRNFAVLTIKPVVENPIDSQMFFGYRHDGEDVIRAVPVTESQTMKIKVLHFSGYGVTHGSTADIDALGSTAERRLSDALAERLGLDRARALMGLEDKPIDIEAFRKAWKEYEETVIQPMIDAAGVSCDAGELAIQTVLAHERDRQLLGESNGEGFGQFADLFNKVARGCMLKRFEACVEHHKWYEMQVAYSQLVQANTTGMTAGIYTSATMNEARDLTIKCVTFRLVFESKATASIRGLQTYESDVEAEIIIRFNPVTGLISGNAEYVNTRFEAGGSCAPAKRGGGTIAVLGLVPTYEGGAPDRDGNFPDARVTDLRLAYGVGPSGETQTCKTSTGTVTGPAATWSLAYYDAHIGEVDPGWPGLTNWKMKLGDLYATREWDLKGGVTAVMPKTEKGSFELYHEPGR